MSERRVPAIDQIQAALIAQYLDAPYAGAGFSRKSEQTQPRPVREGSGLNRIFAWRARRNQPNTSA